MSYKIEYKYTYFGNYVLLTLFVDKIKLIWLIEELKYTFIMHIYLWKIFFILGNYKYI